MQKYLGKKVTEAQNEATNMIVNNERKERKKNVHFNVKQLYRNFEKELFSNCDLSIPLSAHQDASQYLVVCACGV